MNSPIQNSWHALRRSFCMLSQMLKMKLNVTIQIKSKYQPGFGKFLDVLIYSSHSDIFFYIFSPNIFLFFVFFLFCFFFAYVRPQNK
jgi:hypothetical protein